MTNVFDPPGFSPKPESQSDVLWRQLLQTLEAEGQWVPASLTPNVPDNAPDDAPVGTMNITIMRKIQIAPNEIGWITIGPRPSPHPDPLSCSKCGRPY